MSPPTRSPAMVTLDTGAFKLDGIAFKVSSCGHPEHDDLLAIQSIDETVSLAGTVEDLTSFALDILSAVQVFQFESEGSE